MKLFINDKPVKIINQNGWVESDYDVIFEKGEEIIANKLVGNVLVKETRVSQIDRLLNLLEIKKLKKLYSVSFSTVDKDMIQSYVKDSFKIIKASGGIVKKDDKILMIHRLGKWDLPKGKLKKNEDPIEGGRREVEEECNIQVKVEKKLGSTWHSYIRKGKRILKKTDWYQMHCINDDNMRPQTEEFIDEVKWMDKKEVRVAMDNTYKSIEAIIKTFNKIPQSL